MKSTIIWEITLPSSDFVHSEDTGKKWEYNEAVHQLFIDFKKAQ
jgi:hypothetical protein